MNCVVCGNFRADSKTLNLSSVGASTICHIFGIKEPERTRAVVNLQGCKICQECSEHIRQVYATLHKARKVSVEIDEWRLKFFQKLGSDSKPESVAKLQMLQDHGSSVKVLKRHELTKRVRNHIRRELRIDKKGEKITSLKMMIPGAASVPSSSTTQPLIQASAQPMVSFEPSNSTSAAASGGSTVVVGGLSEMHQVEYPQPLQVGEDQQQEQKLTLNFYTEREMEEELLENAKGDNGIVEKGYTLRILDHGAPVGMLEQSREETNKSDCEEDLRKIISLCAKNKRKLEVGLDETSVPNKLAKKSTSTSPSRRKQTIKHSCYDFKRPTAASATVTSSAPVGQMQQQHDFMSSIKKSKSKIPPRPVRATRSSSNASQGLQLAKSLTEVTVHRVQQEGTSSKHDRKRKALPKLRFGESIAVMDDEEEAEPDDEQINTTTRLGEIVDIISYSSILNGSDEEDDDDEDYFEEYEMPYEGGQPSGSEVGATDDAAKEALDRLAALGQCDVEHIPAEDDNDKTDYKNSAPDFGLSLQGFTSAALKNAPFDIINVESPNINCEDSNDAEDVVIVVGY